MSVTQDVWTCPSCEITEHHDPTGLVDRRRWLELVRRGHGERHEAERERAGPIAAALLDAVEQLMTMRVRLVVAPGDLGRVREIVKRRGVPIDVYAGSELPAGRGYVMHPRRGVRELSTDQSSEGPA